MKALIFGIIAVLVFASCGYRPIADYAQESFGNSIYVDLKINLANPENSVYVKDVLNRAILSRFQLKLASKDKADTILIVDVANISETSIATNKDGFTSFYDVSVELRFSYTLRGKEEKSYTSKSTVSYAVAPSALQTNKNKINAIDKAANQAIDGFISYTSYQR